MSRKWIVLGTVAAVVLAFVAGVVVFTNRSSQEVKQAAQTHSDALVRPHSPVFGNPAALLHQRGIGRRQHALCDIDGIFQPDPHIAARQHRLRQQRKCKAACAEPRPDRAVR